MIIPESFLKIKPLRQTFGVVVIKTLCGTLVVGAAFMLGRISAFSEIRPQTSLKIIYPPLVTSSVKPYNPATNPLEPAQWSFVASQTGKTYYPKGCSGINRIKPENRVYFTTADQAQRSGYTLSTACTSL